MSFNSNLSQYITNNGKQITLTGVDLSQPENIKILDNLYNKNPNVTKLDISNCNLTAISEKILNFKKLISLDIRNNNFINFEELVENLTSFNSLTDLKIDLTDQNQVLLILSQIPKLILLNGKSTKDAVNIVDIEEKDIDDISLQNELPLYTEIVNKLNEINEDEEFVKNFQKKIYEEAEKVKNNLNNNNVPNYIYANIVIQSQFNLEKNLCEQFLSKLDEKNKEIGKILIDSIFSSAEKLIGIINNLFPKIEEKTETLRNQLEEAWKAIDENSCYEQKYKELFKEKEMLNNENNLIQNKLKKLENENKLMTEKLIKNAREIYTKNKENLTTSNSNNNNITTNNNNNINNNDNTEENNINNINNNNNNTNSSNLLPITPRILTIKNTKDIMSEIYTSKSNYDKKCFENKLPRETMEQHMYTYLNQKYGLKNLIIEWASSIINAIKLYSNEDSDINLFGKILRNEQEEDSRLILSKLRNTIVELLEYYLKSKSPLKSQIEIKKMLEKKKEGILTEEEWKGIIYYIYTQEDAQAIEIKISNFINKNKERNNVILTNNNNFNYNNNYNYNNYNNNNFTDVIQTHSGNLNTNQNYLNTVSNSKINNNNYNLNNKKLTREEIFNLTKLNEEMTISFKDFLKLVSDYQIKSREKYLKNFVKLFRKFDTDSDGVLNENEFINLIKDIPYCQNNIDEYTFKFLSIIDPFNNKKITFSECVSLFSMEIIDDGNNNNFNNNNSNNNSQITLLDKICLES